MIVEIYSKDDCPYCQMAKTLLAQRNINFSEYVLNRDFSKEQLVEKFPSAKTFPVIVLDGFYIGGYTQLKEQLSSSVSNQILLNE